MLPPTLFVFFLKFQFTPSRDSNCSCYVLGVIFDVQHAQIIDSVIILSFKNLDVMLF